METTISPVSTETWQRTMKSKGINVLHISVQRPSFPGSGKKRRMEHYFAQMALQWQTRWENDLYQKACLAFEDRQSDPAFQPWCASFHYEITLWNPPLLSIRINVQEQGPVALPVSLCIGEVWDCSSGYPCSLRTFLPAKPYRWKKHLILQLQQQAEQRLDSGESLLYPNCLSMIEQTFDPSRFYLSEHGLVIFYPLYSLGSYGEGIPTFTIPVL